MEQVRKYWMVHCPGYGSPSVMHNMKEIACKEAERLSRAHPGKEFFVLESVASVERNDVKHRGEWPDEVPF